MPRAAPADWVERNEEPDGSLRNPPAVLARFLDHLEGRQDEDGGWHDEHALPQWRAYTTIVVLHGLRAHGREIGGI